MFKNFFHLSYIMAQQHNVAKELHKRFSCFSSQVSNTAHAVYVLYITAGGGRFLKHTIKSQIDFLLSRQPLVSIHLWMTERWLLVSHTAAENSDILKALFFKDSVIFKTL